MVNYYYDAWGNHKVLNSDGTENTSATFIGNLNPFRYRSYFYDTETKLYFLQSRYYDPEVGRFLNMDSVSYADPEATDGLNLYAYCGNNPVMGVDPDGSDWYHWVIGALVVVALVAATFVSAGSIAGGLAALTAAAHGVASATVATTVLSFAAVGAGTVYAASAVVASISSVETWASGGSFASGVNVFMNQGESAMWATIWSGALGAADGYISHVDFGTKTPGQLRPFGTYYNTNDETITHYGWNGKMSWSQHLTDHGRPDLHQLVPHWHAEKPHYPRGGFTRRELIKELILRFFGRGNK